MIDGSGGTELNEVFSRFYKEIFFCFALPF